MNQQTDVSTRTVILTMIKTKGSLTVSEISKQLGITEMAVRRHLGNLERAGLIEARLVRQAMGRPTNMYSLTPDADDLFPKKYQQLVLDFLGDLIDELGEDQVQRLFERRKDRMIQRYETQMDEKSLEDRVKQLAEIQNASGYMVEWQAVGDGTFQLNEHNCPIAQVANHYQHACQCELAMFEQLLNAVVERKECLAKGGAQCSYLIQAHS